MIPPNLERRFLGRQNNNNKITETVETIASNLNAFWNGTGIIIPESPTTKRMLKILLPTIFPTAISEFFFIAAVTEVNNSGKDVPKATIVNPMNLSLKPKNESLVRILKDMRTR